jgi:hypothetical protein
VWRSLAGVGTLGILITTLTPRFSEGTCQPPAPPFSLEQTCQPSVAMLLGVGLVLIAAASVGVYLGIRSGLGLAAKVAIYAVGFNGLILLVKFVLAPYGIYDLNRTVPVSSIAPFTEPFAAVLAGGLVFLLYFAVFGLVYRVARARAGYARRPRRRNPRVIVVLWIAGSLLMAAAAGLGVLLLPLLPAVTGGDYVSYVFSSSASLAVGLTLATATWLAGRTFGAATQDPRAVGDAALLSSLFWFGLSFIALYHFLWVVYLLVLVSIWPLRVVVPK